MLHFVMSYMKQNRSRKTGVMLVNQTNPVGVELLLCEHLFQ